MNPNIKPFAVGVLTGMFVCNCIYLCNDIYEQYNNDNKSTTNCSRSDLPDQTKSITQKLTALKLKLLD